MMQKPQSGAMRWYSLVIALLSLAVIVSISGCGSTRTVVSVGTEGYCAAWPLPPIIAPDGTPRPTIPVGDLGAARPCIRRAAPVSRDLSIAEPPRVS